MHIVEGTHQLYILDSKGTKGIRLAAQRSQSTSHKRRNRRNEGTPRFCCLLCYVFCFVLVFFYFFSSRHLLLLLLFLFFFIFHHHVVLCCVLGQNVCFALESKWTEIAAATKLRSSAARTVHTREQKKEEEK